MHSAESSPATSPSTRPAAPDRPLVARSMVSKVPVVTASFWVLKILTTGMGEAASDALVRWGGGLAIVVTAVAPRAGFVAQFRGQHHVPGIYLLAGAVGGGFWTNGAGHPP